MLINSPNFPPILPLPFDVTSINLNCNARVIVTLTFAGNVVHYTAYVFFVITRRSISK